jgi:hypothetical protein
VLSSRGLAVTGRRFAPFERQRRRREERNEPRDRRAVERCVADWKEATRSERRTEWAVSGETAERANGERCVADQREATESERRPTGAASSDP